jgi:3-deoxy-D-manno-octulosonate 8-phosphate phosphatase (KDO 8-P phosphatase)
MTVEKLKNVKLLLLDVDGVMTDGGIIYNDHGEETKKFNCRDGLGLRLLMDAGIEVGIVTGRKSGVLMHRCENLGISLIFDGVIEKGRVLEPILQQTRIDSEEIAFMGDDLIDLPLMKKVGLAVTVADAHETVLEYAHLITCAKGGAGAVREVCEAILKAKGLWANIIGRFLQ